jgi:hypothetical protein
MEEESMLFDSTRTLLRTVLQSLETGDEMRWDDHFESGNQCLYELHQMSRPAHQAYKIDKLNPKSGGAPVSGRTTRAIPHVKLMMGAIRRRDVVSALEFGRAAIVEMDGVNHSRPPAEPVAPIAQPAPQAKETPKQVKEPPKMVQRHKKPAARKRPTAAKANAVRTTVARST